jgi:hypothetical protein
MALKECTLGTPYPGAAGRTFDISNRAWPRLLRGKGGAADALFIVQYGTGPDQLRCGCYGSSIEGPDFDAPAKGSVLSNNVHTTALFADLPPRSCILTSRNHHSNAMPCITEGFPPAISAETETSRSRTVSSPRRCSSTTTIQYLCDRRIAPSTCRPDIGITIS